MGKYMGNKGQYVLFFVKNINSLHPILPQIHSTLFFPIFFHSTLFPLPSRRHTLTHTHTHTCAIPLNPFFPSSPFPPPLPPPPF